MSKVSGVWLALALLVAVLAACAPAPRNSGAESDPVATAATTGRRVVTVEDALGRKIELAVPLRRAVVVYSQLVLALRAIDIDDRDFIATDEFTRDQFGVIFPALRQKAMVGRHMVGLDAERLMNLDAEVLLTAPPTLTREPELEARLARVGIKVICLDFDLNNAARTLALLGILFDREAEARAFTAFWLSKVRLATDVVKSISRDKRTRVYWENTNVPYATINKHSIGHDLLEAAGGESITAELRGVKADPEWIIARDPDVIIKYPMGAGYQGGFLRRDDKPFRDIRDELMTRSGFDRIRAVRDGRVYIVSYLIKTGLFENVGICYIAKILYPDLLRDLDPESHFREMTEKYLGLDYDKVRGILVYPEPWAAVVPAAGRARTQP